MVYDKSQLKEVIRVLKKIQKHKSGWRKWLMPLSGTRGICYYMGEWYSEYRLNPRLLKNLFKSSCKYSGCNTFAVKGVLYVEDSKRGNFTSPAAFCYRSTSKKYHNWYGSEYSKNRWKMVQDMIDEAERLLKLQGE